MANPQYAARICWNSAGWVYPAGEAAILERNPNKEWSKQTYSVKNKFGHEEWLFNFNWILDEWKYAYLQGVGRSFKKLSGKTIDVRLFSVAGQRKRFYVGELKNCEVLTVEQAALALSAYKRNHWLAAMKQQIQSMGGNPNGLRRPLEIFNIRFRPEDADIYEPLAPVSPSDYAMKLHRYSLAALTGRLLPVAGVWPTRAASHTKNRTGRRYRKGTVGRHFDPIHDIMQDEIVTCLKNQYGASAVEKEKDFIDIKVKLRSL